uniref:NAD(P)H-dependent glycerol-3-phosphate dehydrogenase n=1 Tax=Alistipes shahii TaxID=328814 RepID=UPI003AB6180C
GKTQKVKTSGSLCAPSRRRVICIPSGSTNVAIRAVRDSAEHAGGREVYMIYEPMAAALGAGLDVEAPEGTMVIGYGSWATAIVGLLAANGRRVGWYVRNPEVLESLCSDGRNPRYLNDLEFDRNSIAPSSDLDAVVRDADIVILATPSAYLKDFLAPLTVPLRDKFVVSAIKGIVPGDYQTVVEYIHDHYGLSYRQIGLVTGPSHAEEVSRGKLSYLTVVCADPENARRIGERFAGENIRLSYSADLYGVEYAAILKNIYALSVGIAVGLGYGDNFLAVLIANAAGEMTRFLEESYPDERNTQVSAYLGDLLVTCYSTYSRNRRLGLLIGHGCTVKSALNEMTMVAEGYFAADCIRHINFRHRVDMPIADMVYRVLYEGASARRCMQELTTKLI